MSNPWNLTEREIEALSALVETGCQKVVANRLGVGKARVSRIVGAASKRMGERNHLRALIEWDRWDRKGSEE